MIGSCCIYNRETIVTARFPAFIRTPKMFKDINHIRAERFGTRKVDAWRIEQRSEKIIETRLMNKYNKTDFFSCLASIDWMQVFSNLSFDPNRMTDAFYRMFESVLNFHIAIRK